MIAKQIMQSTIEGMASIARIGFKVLDAEGRLIAAAPTAAEAIPEEIRRAVREFAASPADTQEIRGAWFFKIYNGDQLEYVLIADGSADNAHTLGRMAAFQLSGLTIAYRERFDSDNFIKNLLLDNLLLVDIYSRAKKLHIAGEARRVCLVIRPGEGRDESTAEIIRNAVDAERDFVTEIDESDIIVVREVPARDAEGNNDESAETRELRGYASGLLERLERGGMKGLRIACGTIAADLKDVSRSYKEAKMALDVSRIFYEKAHVVCYGELGIGRLIYQLPLPLCRMFLAETFGECRPDQEIDQEIIDTVDVFFENSLNVSETSRKLFIHRNTLVYRLDKLLKITGLDVRIFEDAMIYRIAMMVVKYMKYMEEANY